MALFSTAGKAVTGKEIVTGGLSAGGTCLLVATLGGIIHAATSRHKLLNKHLTKIDSLRRNADKKYKTRIHSFHDIMGDKGKLKVN